MAPASKPLPVPVSQDGLQPPRAAHRLTLQEALHLLSHRKQRGAVPEQFVDQPHVAKVPCGAS